MCGGGFIHGVIETVLGESKDPGRDLLRVCAPDNSGSCFHGVGHGVMFATGMDVPAALDLCDRSPSPELSNRCGEGVFMQLFSSDLSAQHVAGEETVDIARDPTRAQARCRTVRAHYAANCWFYVPTVYLTAHPDDFAAAMAWCRDSGTSVGRQLCARGVGSRAVKYHPDDLSVADATCSAAGRAHRLVPAGHGFVLVSAPRGQGRAERRVRAAGPVPAQEALPRGRVTSTARTHSTSGRCAASCVNVAPSSVLA